MHVLTMSIQSALLRHRPIQRLRLGKVFNHVTEIVDLARTRQSRDSQLKDSSENQFGLLDSRQASNPEEIT